MVAPLKVIREGHKFHLPVLMMVEHGIGHIEEGFCPAGATVIDAGLALMFPEPEVDLADVLDIDKVTHLTTITITIASLKQLGIVALLDLIVQMKGDAGHASLMLFAGAVNVEVF